MRILKKISWGVIALLLVFFTAGSFQDYSITFSPSEQGFTENISIIFMPPEDVESIKYTLQGAPESVYASSGPGSEFELDGNDLYIYDDFKSGEESEIIMSLVTDVFVEKIGDVNVFSFKFIPPERLNKFQVSFILPKGYVISDIDPSISPRPTQITSDGRSIHIIWRFEGLEESVNFIVLYEGGKSGSWALAAVVILIIITLSLFYMSNRKQKRLKGTMHRTFDENEQKIIDLLRQNPEMTQKDLVYHTGFSKAKMSKVVRKLEKKGVLEKKPHMTTNKLNLKKEFKD